MLYISHRGNLNGINPKQENKPSYIFDALERSFDVEVDVWFVKGKFYLGHDEPKDLIDDKFLKIKKLWFHSKNIEALYELTKLNVKCFWHQNDDVTLTSNGFIWTYPGKPLTEKSICVLPELNNIKTFNCAGICSDFILDYYNEQN
tara:strand:- start:158 stop:595 length:438 start_codon:yes stop_codon:yes gene_type:complete